MRVSGRCLPSLGIQGERLGNITPYMPALIDLYVLDLRVAYSKSVVSLIIVDLSTLNCHGAQPERGGTFVELSSQMMQLLCSFT